MVYTSNKREGELGFAFPEGCPKGVVSEASRPAGHSEYGGGVDGGTVGVGLVVRLGLINCHTQVNLSGEPGNIHNMLSPP